MASNGRKRPRFKPGALKLRGKGLRLVTVLGSEGPQEVLLAPDGTVIDDAWLDGLLLGAKLRKSEDDGLP